MYGIWVNIIRRHSMRQNINQFSDECIENCPIWIIDKSVESLKRLFMDDLITDITEAHEKDPETWWALYHHGWGTNIRNYLRDNVCLDDKLPTNNWDDYYIQFVEMACGIRQWNF